MRNRLEIEKETFPPLSDFFSSVIQIPCFCFASFSPVAFSLSRFPFTFLDSFQSAHSHTRHGTCFPGSS